MSENQNTGSPIAEQTSQIMSEMLHAAETLANIGPAVSVFGSARIKPESIHYERAHRIGELLARAGVTEHWPGAATAEASDEQRPSGRA